MRDCLGHSAAIETTALLLGSHALSPGAPVFKDPSEEELAKRRETSACRECFLITYSPQKMQQRKQVGAH